MTMIHEVKCDFCGTREQAVEKGLPQYLTYKRPDKWSIVEKDSEALHLCPSCTNQLEKDRKQ